MILLFFGLLFFSGLHMMPLCAQNMRDKIISALGPRPYKALFALASLGSFVLIVLGWQASEIEYLYTAPVWGRHVTPLFVLVGILLFIASNAPTNIRRLIRHPQLIGVTLWGIGHLFSNGETRSILLFGGLIIFSLSAIFASNKRDGEWIKREPVPRSRDIITVVIGLFVFAAAFYYHSYLTGIPLISN